MDVLDYIYQNLDSTLAYYDHAGCALGICARCTGRVNGKAGLFCQVPVSGDVTLEPIELREGAQGPGLRKEIAGFAPSQYSFRRTGPRPHTPAWHREV